MGRNKLLLVWLVAAGCGQANEPVANGDSELTRSNELIVKVGVGFGCVLDPGQGVYCWGDNHFGQLGQAPSKFNGPAGLNESSTPIFIDGTKEATVLELGDSHACVLTPTDVLCWGNNGSDQIGVTAAPDTCWDMTSHAGYFSNPCQPTATSLGLGPKVWLSAGGAATCLGDDSGTTCRGSAMYGLAASTGLTAIGISADSLCGLNAAGKLQCGGDPAADDYAIVQTLGPIESFVLGNGSDICVITVGGALQCWGSNNSAGELGAGHTGIVDPWLTTTPVKSSVQIVAGVRHFCSLSQDGAVQCWGASAEGQVGRLPVEFGGIEMNDPDSYELPAGVCPGGPCEPAAVLVDGVGSVSSIAAGGDSTCAVTDARQVKCWGQLVGTSVPTVVAGPWSE